MFKKQNIASFTLGLFSGVIIKLVYFGWLLNLDALNTFSQLIMATSAFLAFVNYYERKQDKIKKEALNQINFFRENIIKKQSEIVLLVRKVKGSSFEFFRIESFDIDDLEASFTKENIDKIASISKVEGVYELALDLLNTLDQFALSVEAHKLEDEKLLTSIKAAYIQIIEINLYFIASSRVIGTASDNYNTLLKLYKKWQSSIDRTSPEQRLKEFKERFSLQPHHSSVE